MEREEFDALVNTAERLLPKYGGFVSGAVNQASLLLGIRLSKWDRSQVEAFVKLESLPEYEDLYDQGRADSMEGGE